MQLPGPFTPCADSRLPPYPASLNPAWELLLLFTAFIGQLYLILDEIIQQKQKFFKLTVKFEFS